MKSPLLIICGLHRSGTTYVGRILDFDRTVSVIHEPFNVRFGLAGGQLWYPYIEDINDPEALFYRQFADDAVCFRRRWSHDVSHITSTGLRRWFYERTGGKSGLRWEMLRLRYRLRLSMPRICWKDPFVTLSTSYLLNQFGARAVCLVRHPAAIHVSTNRQEWRYDIENLLRQHSLIRNYAYDIPERYWELAKDDAAASIALLWKIMVRINIPIAAKDNRLLIVRHEELCLEPEEIAAKIVFHLGLEFTSSMRQYVLSMSTGQTAEAHNGKTHSFKRDSRALISSWRDKISKNDEHTMREIIGEDLNLCYPEW